MAINTEQLKGFLAFMVKNNQRGVVKALQTLGYTPSGTASGLVDQLMVIYSTKGTNGLSAIFVKVPIIASNTTQEELAAIQETLTGEKIDLSVGKFSWQDFAALWSGSSVTGGGTSTTTETKTPALGATAVIVISIVAIIGIILLVKFLK